MIGSITRNAHQASLLLAEMEARKVVLIGTTINSRWNSPNNIKKPFNALSIFTSSCFHNIHGSDQATPGMICLGGMQYYLILAIIILLAR